MFRIPTIIKTSSGKLLAFCEGRKSLFDHGSIDLVMKTSKDNGSSWTPLKVVWTNRPNTCGNPSPVLDTISGDIIIVATLTNDKVFVLRSKDDGRHGKNLLMLQARLRSLIGNGMLLVQFIPYS